MENPLISVIVLSYNNLYYFKECLESLFSQNYNNVELIFSDDGSPDFNNYEIEKFINENKSSNIKNISINHNKSNLGTVKNYNNSIKKSRGKYIYTLAIDDVFWDENVLSDVVGYFETTKCLILTGYRAIYDKTMQQHLDTYPRKDEAEIIKTKTPRQLYLRICENNFIAGACTPFSMEFIEKYGYFDEDYILLEDYPKYLSILRQNCKIYFMDRILIKYRNGGVSTSDVKNEIFKRDLELAIKKEILPYKQIIMKKQLQ